MTTIALAILAVGTLCGLLEISASPLMAHVWLALERRRAGLAKATLRVGAFDMPYLHRGNTEETLVLIHGFGADKDHFTRVCAHLDRSRRILVPDLPGFGDASRDHDARYRIADQVERLHQFMCALGVRRVHLGGNSMGGFIAAQYAATYPDRVASLWLLDAAGCKSATKNEFFESYARTGEIPLLVRTSTDFDTLVEACVTRPTWIPRSVRRYLCRRATHDFGLHRRILADLVEDSPLLDTQGIELTVPTFLVWGADDRILNPACSEEQRQVFPNSRTVVMPTTGHLPMIERPRAVARDYQRFMASSA